MNHRSRVATLILMLTVTSSLFATSAAALQESIDPAIEASYNRLTNGLMSPFCAGRTLQHCPTSGAAQIRADIRTSLQAGESESAITERLVQEYGEVMLGAPRLRGFGWAGWLAMPLALFAGAWFVIRFIRRTAAPTTAVDGTGEVIPPSLLGTDREFLLQRMEAELAESD